LSPKIFTQKHSDIGIIRDVVKLLTKSLSVNNTYFSERNNGGSHM